MLSGIELSAPALFIAGATTSLHCALMCGAVNAMQMRSQGTVPLGQTLALVHGGRVLGYALLGALAGALGARFAEHLPRAFTGQTIQLLAAAMLMVAALQQLGSRAHARHRAPCLAAQRSRFSRLPPRLRLFGQGLLWALMPCGILYTVVLLATFTAHPFGGALLLAAFGLGTVPLMGVTGGLFGLATRPQDTRMLRGIAAGVLLLAGVATAGSALGAQGLWTELWCLPQA